MQLRQLLSVMEEEEDCPLHEGDDEVTSYVPKEGVVIMYDCDEFEPVTRIEVTRKDGIVAKVEMFRNEEMLDVLMHIAGSDETEDAPNLKCYKEFTPE